MGPAGLIRMSRWTAGELFRRKRWVLSAPGRVCRLLVAGVLVAGAGCGQPPDVEGEAVFASVMEAAASDTAAAGESAPSPEADPGIAAADGADAPEATETPSSPPIRTPEQSPPQATMDSLAAVLREITEAQRLILSRLDSIEGGVAAGPSPLDTAAVTITQIREATDDVRNLGVKIFWSLVILLIFHVLIRVVIWVLETLAERSVARRLSFKWLIPITRMVLWAIAAYLIMLNVFRVDAQGLLAASAALGVAVGIAAQDMLRNVLGGLIVVLDQPFQVGDKIRVGGSYGEVVSIGLRSTRIVTADDNLVSIPNSQVVGEQVANANAGKLNCQVVTDLYLPGRVDERKAKEIAFEAAVTSQYVFLNKPIAVLVRDDFRTTFVTRIRIRAYVLDPRFEFVFQSDVTERAREGFRAAGLMPDRDWYPVVEAVEAGSEAAGSMGASDR